MVSAALLALAAPTPIGVVQVGVLQVRTGTTAQDAPVGSVLRSGDTVRSPDDGWGEVSLVPDGRLRLSASTSVRLDARSDEVQLDEGRVWLQRPRRGWDTVAINVYEGRIEVPQGASVVVERTRSGGVLIVVRAGRASFRSEGGRRVIEVGQVLRVTPGEASLPRARAGGRALADLVATEARVALFDPSSVREYLLVSSRKLTRVPRPMSTLDDPLRSSAESLGADAGGVGALIEAGLRPAPFFEDEVPTKGPNLRVEVRFP